MKTEPSIDRAQPGRIIHRLAARELTPEEKIAEVIGGKGAAGTGVAAG
jgi:hypothetical protein